MKQNYRKLITHIISEVDSWLRYCSTPCPDRDIKDMCNRLDHAYNTFYEHLVLKGLTTSFDSFKYKISERKISGFKLFTDITDELKNRTYLAYNGNNFLLYVEDPMNVRIFHLSILTYDGKGRLESEYDRQIGYGRSVEQLAPKFRWLFKHLMKLDKFIEAYIQYLDDNDPAARFIGE